MKVSRVEELEYAGPWVDDGSAPAKACEPTRGCVSFMPRKLEVAVLLEGRDVSGLDPALTIHQDLDGDGRSDLPAKASTTCGRTAKAVRVRPGYLVEVRIGPSAGMPCRAGAATRGTLTAVLLRRRR